MRCLNLANEIRCAGSAVEFAMREGKSGLGIVRKRGFPVHVPPRRTFDYTDWLRDLVRSSGSRTLVLDTRDDLSRATLLTLRSEGCLIAAIDDSTERRMACDWVFYPPVPQLQELDWVGFEGKTRVGWEWTLLGLTSSTLENLVRTGERSTDVLVNMGGSDPENLTPWVTHTLLQMVPRISLHVVLGPAYSGPQMVEGRVTAESGRLVVSREPPDLHQIMAMSRLAVVSYGVIAMELAALGVPALYLCRDKDHEQSASALVSGGAGACLGLFSEVSDSKLLQSVKDLYLNEPSRLRMETRGRQLIDGRAAHRIASVLLNR